MRRVYRVFLAFGLIMQVVGCGGNGGSSGNGGNSKTSITTVNTGSSRDLLDLAYSPAGTIYLSADFTAQVEPSVLRSTDQGRTWSTLNTATRPSLFVLWAIDDKNLVAANRAVYRSTDQAATWSISAFDEEDGIGVRDLYFVNAYEAVLSKGSTIYYSIDGGHFWQEVYYNAVLGAAVCDRFSFPDAQTGYCAGGAVWIDPRGGGTNNGNVLKTVDGGKTWTSLELYPKFHMAAITGMQFVSSTTGFIFTFNREVFKTSDGGSSWKLVSSNVPATYASPFFLDERTGVIAVNGASDTGIVYETRDGGVTWREVFDASSAILKLRIVDTDTAFFVGRNGLLGKIVLKP